MFEIVRLWISPEGEEFRLPDEISHNQFAASRLNYPKAREQEAREKLLADGWIRISTGEVEGRVGPIELEWPRIRRWVNRGELLDLFILVTTDKGVAQGYTKVSLARLPERLDLDLLPTTFYPKTQRKLHRREVRVREHRRRA